MHYNKSPLVLVNNILLIDDDKEVLVALKAMLSSEISSNVQAYDDPQEAFEQFQKSSNSYDLILSDVKMPKMNGFELARIIRMINPNIPIILMTAFPIKKSELEMLLPSATINDTISKPFSLSQLQSILERYIVRAA